MHSRISPADGETLFCNGLNLALPQGSSECQVFLVSFVGSLDPTASDYSSRFQPQGDRPVLTQVGTNLTFQIFLAVAASNSTIFNDSLVCLCWCNRVPKQAGWGKSVLGPIRASFAPLHFIYRKKNLISSALKACSYLYTTGWRHCITLPWQPGAES